MHKSDNDMKQAAAFVYYEYEQFRWAILHLPKGWRCGTAGVFREEDAVVEVALLHARVLRDFFTRKRCCLPHYSKSDIIAEDFFDNPKKWDPPVFSYLHDNKKRLDRSLAHLSYSRREYEQPGRKEWDFEATSTELMAAWKVFWGKLPEERRAWFIDDEDELWDP